METADYGSLSYSFGLYKQAIQILQQNNAKKYQSGIPCQDLNTPPSEYESPSFIH